MCVLETGSEDLFKMCGSEEEQVLLQTHKLKLKRNWAGETNNHQRYYALPLKEKAGLEENPPSTP